MPKTRSKAVGIRWVSKREMRKLLDSKARRVLGFSGAEFQTNYASGKIARKHLDGKAGTVELATLCLFTGGKRASKNRKRSGR